MTVLWKFQLNILIVVILLVTMASFTTSKEHKLICGFDNSPIDVVYEGIAPIEMYPWLGKLYYPQRLTREQISTAVILISKEIVIGAANDIDRIPKTDFRERARVILGFNCSGEKIRIRDYTYHPDYSKNTYSTLTLIHLDTDLVKQVLRPVCPPPKRLIEPDLYAMTLTNDCSNTANVYKMLYVDPEQCKKYYRRNDLDVSTMWPTHAACARASARGECVWLSGTALMVRHNQVWRLLGFGIEGPGCGAPSRFLDYGQYARWVHTSLARVGRPAITRLSGQHLIMRRTLSSVQRFGPCDPEEVKMELYTDTNEIKPQTSATFQRLKYNLTIFANVEYSCISLQISETEYTYEPASLALRRWCMNQNAVCYDFSFLQIDFYVEITFDAAITFKVSTYGTQARVVDFKKVLNYVNKQRPMPRIKPLPTQKSLLFK